MQPELGSMIRQHRKKAGLTQKELAELAGVGKTIVFDLEHDRQTVRLDKLLPILKVLNIQIKLTSPLLNQQTDAQG